MRRLYFINIITRGLNVYKLRRSIHQSCRCNAAIVINGKKIAESINKEIKSEVDKIVAVGRRPPHVSVVLVGNDPASVIYVQNKIKTAKQIGMTSGVIHLQPDVSEATILTRIAQLNESSTVDGILIQLPVPSHIRERVVCDAVLPEKDVDGFGVTNVGRFCVDEPAFIPATPAGVIEIIRHAGVPTFGKNAVVIGRSKNVGLPIALHLLADDKTGNATTTVCHRFTPADELALLTRNADLIVTAVGKPGLITADMIKPGVAVIDVGISRIIDAHSGKAKLLGDVDFEGVSQKAGFITPVPGGVGPCTVAMLMKNTLSAYRRDIDFYSNSSQQI